MKPRSASHSSSRSRSAKATGTRRAKSLRVSRAGAPKSTGAKKSRGSKKTTQIKGNAEITIDHDEIQHWAEDRGGIPAVVKRTHQREDEGILRIDFPGFSGEHSLDHISWEEWFDIFEHRQLAFLCQKRKVNGEQSTFNKLVSRSELI
ncbi:MAG TPA: hypothetical protein VFB72_01610 [Verrucomicrobiae bacterium]|nr:hypothetical protein [Verrucomicrobiae bacterium]